MLLFLYVEYRNIHVNMRDVIVTKGIWVFMNEYLLVVFFSFSILLYILFSSFKINSKIPQLPQLCYKKTGCQLPGRTTHRMQPLDVALFGLLQIYFTQAQEI